MANVLQAWLGNLTVMQQTVVIELTRGPDGLTKYHPSKYLLRWFRRCFLISAFDERDLHLNPETEEQLDKRLGDNRDGWIAAGDLATVA